MSNFNNKPGQAQGQQNNAQRPGTPSANTNRPQQGQKGAPQGSTKPNMGGGASHTNKDDRKK
jgi:hypothetical protein